MAIRSPVIIATEKRAEIAALSAFLSGRLRETPVTMAAIEQALMDYEAIRPHPREQTGQQILAFMRQHPDTEFDDATIAEWIGMEWMTAYCTMSFLVYRDMVASRWEGPDDDGKPSNRRLYRLTTAGAER
jgi:hypothetical protein